MNQLLRVGFYSVWVGLLVLITVAWAIGSYDLIAVDAGNALLASARFSGLVGTFLLLWQLLLVSRAPWLERIHGFDMWTRIHRINGFSAFSLVTLHIPLVVAGNALLTGTTAAEQTVILLTAYDHVILAAIAYGLLLITVGASVTMVRSRVRYETWYFVHLLNYLILALVVWHQIAHGATLTGQEWFLYVWYALYMGIALHLIWFRLAAPVKLNFKHRFRLSHIEAETPGVYSYYIRGRRLREYDYLAGQFAKWRFWQRGLWFEEHPFTLSVAPNREYLRLTAKQVGDFTGRLPGVRPGIPVWISNPLGRFTLQQTRNRKLLLIAGGIGVTPIRSLLEAAGADYDISIIYAARTGSDFALSEELEQLADIGRHNLHYITSQKRASGASFGLLDREMLVELTPDVSEREVFLCGPPTMMDAVSGALVSADVDPGSIHTERFSL